MSDLSRLLAPRTIAVIGGKECERVIEQCDKLGFEGTIWPVHPRREAMGGRACFKSVQDLPSAPDAAYVAVNRERTIDVISDLRKQGAGGAVCYAAGFAEADSESAGSVDLQRQLVEAAGDMPIIGPNCYGFINAVERVALWPDQHGAIACDKGVAILTQSSNIAINLSMQKRGLPIAYMMTVGNQAQQGLSKLGMAMLEDDHVTALGLHIEGLDDLASFETLARRARELKKPIIAIKVGKSEQAQAAALTHTASLAGSDAAHEALFRRLGIGRVDTVESFIETLKLVHVLGPLSGFDLLSMSCSGGEASLMADMAHGRKVVFRPFTGKEVAPLKEELGEIVTIANPLDYHTFIWGNWPAMKQMFEVALAPRFDLALLVMVFPRSDRCDPDDWDQATNSFMLANAEIQTPSAVVASMQETMPEKVAHDLINVGIVPLCGLENSIIAAEVAAMIGQTWRQDLPAPLLSSQWDASESVLETLSESQSKRELSKLGLVVPKGVVIHNMNDIDTAMRGLEFPMVLKALGIAHKTEMGAVKLNLKSTQEVLQALAELSSLSKSFLLEEMAPKPLAELIVGVSRDPVVGLMMTLGAGGVLAELLSDTASILLPTDETEIRSTLADLKIGRLLDGYRDSDAADIDALIANIVCIANYAVRHESELQELDVNPLFATQFGSVAVDALIVKRKMK